MNAITRLYVATPPPMVFPWFPFILAGVLGPTVAVIAAAVPALLTVRVAPVEAMRPQVTLEGSRSSLRLTLLGVVLLAASGSMEQAAVHGWLPASLAIYFTVAFIAAAVLLIPLVLDPLARAVTWLLSPVLRLEGRLAYRQVLRRPVRTALDRRRPVYRRYRRRLGLGTTVINNVNDVRKWSRQTLAGDFYVRASLPDTVNGCHDPSSGGDRGRDTPNFRRYQRGHDSNISGVHAADHAAAVVARQFSDPHNLGLDLLEADPATVRQNLLAGEVVVGTVLAQHAGVKLGDSITLKTRGGDRTFRVGGFVVDYMVGGYIVYMQRSVAERSFGIEGVDAFLVNAAPGDRPDVQAELEKLCEQNGLMLQSNAELARSINTIVNGVVGGLWGILVLALLVAAFGVANTLTMNVLEQTRELALLRVVAMTRRQVRKMVLSQAGIIGIIGLALGNVLRRNPGLPHQQGHDGGCWATRCLFIVQPVFLTGCFVAGLALVLAAALLPAERAAQLDLLIALQYE